jgi:hypothetical protein
MPTIVQDHKKNFETLKKAFKNGAVCLMDCVEKCSGEHVAVICTSMPQEDGGMVFVPFARFFNGNPYSQLIPPGDNT